MFIAVFFVITMIPIEALAGNDENIPGAATPTAASAA